MVYIHCVLLDTMPTVAERYKFADVEKDGKNLITEMQKFCKVQDMLDVKQDFLTRSCTKDVLATHLVRALEMIERQHMFVINQRVHISAYQSDIIQLQSDLISAQKKSINMFQENVNKFRRELSEAVQDTVESSISKSYSEAVESQTGNSPVIGQESLKLVAKQVVVEEELSRNVMVFGLCDDENEDLNLKIGEVFEHLGEKPRVEARRLGKKTTTAAARPVKVTLSSSTIVQQILSKSKKLRLSEKHKTVFLSPDRTAEERLKQKEIVAELKRKVAQEPNKRHFIKGVQVVTIDIPVT